MRYVVLRFEVEEEPQQSDEDLYNEADTVVALLVAPPTWTFDQVDVLHYRPRVIPASNPDA